MRRGAALRTRRASGACGVRPGRHTGGAASLPLDALRRLGRFARLDQAEAKLLDRGVKSMKGAGIEERPQQGSRQRRSPARDTRLTAKEEAKQESKSECT